MLKLARVDVGNVVKRVKIWKVFLLVGLLNRTLSIYVIHNIVTY